MNTEQKILVVAKFAGFTKEKNLGWYDNEMLLPQHIYDVNQGNCFNENELLFSVSWDWLMPIISKCREEQIHGSQYLINNIEHRLLKNDILSTFYNVFEFIQFYNNQLNKIPC